MSSPVVYVLVIVAACAVAGTADVGTIDCYDAKGKLLKPLPTRDLFRCKPWCPPDCPPGGCMFHNRCNCGPGYRDARTRYEIRKKKPARCQPVCTDACINADCVAPDTCKCHMGFMMSPDKSYECVRSARPMFGMGGD